MPAELIDGRYRIVKRLGGGAFSDVFLVEGPRQARCALKLLKGAAAMLKKRTLEEFKQEFSILKDMRHPNIAAILDFGFDEVMQQYYYTSEFIEGMDIFHSTDGVSLDEIVNMVVEVLRALEYLHSYRVYHFDIKAANILSVSGGVPHIKIIDFGLAGIDPSGRLIGTPSYMAPEIVMKEHADGRADLYSLGVLLYYILTRKNPFRAPTTDETLARQRQFIPPPPSQEGAAVPKWIDPIVMKLLEKNPAARYSHASAIIRDINRLGNKDYPLETYQTLLSYIPEEGRFVGRAAELAIFDDVLARLKGTQGGLVEGLLVRGAFGTGKTRILHEAKHTFQLNDIIVYLASASEKGALSDWCTRLTGHLTQGRVPAPYRTVRGPAVFLLDDVQDALRDEFAKSELLAALSRSKRLGSDARTLIVFAADSEGPIFNELCGLPVRTIELAPFDWQEVRQYLSSLTGLESPPELLETEIYRRTEGNPLLLTEVIKSLIASGGLFDEQGRWKDTTFEDIGADFTKAGVPKTVAGLLLSRIEKLPATQRRISEVLAVAGGEATIAELASWSAIGETYIAVADMLKNGILERRESLKVGFTNTLLGHVVYESIPSDSRTRLHDKIASSLVEKGGAREEILHHQGKGSDTARALGALTELGETELAAGRGRGAAHYFEEALDLADQLDSGRRIDVQMKLGEAYLIGRDYEAAKRILYSIESLIAESSANPAMARWSAEALIRLGGLYIKLQEFTRARAVLEGAKRAFASAGGDRVREIVVENFIAEVLFQEGDLEGAGQKFEETRAMAEGLSAGERRGITNNDLGLVLLSKGDVGRAMRIFGEDLDLAAGLADDLLIARSHYNLAQAYSRQGGNKSATEAYETCVGVCRRSKNTELLLRAYNGLGNICQVIGDYEKALKYYERGRDLHERTKDQRGGAAISINMGIVEHLRGADESALDHLVPAIEYLKSLSEKGAADWAALARGLLEVGDVMLKRGDYGGARHCLEESVSIIDKVPQAGPYRFWTLVALAHVAKHEGKGVEFSQFVSELQKMAHDDKEREIITGLKKEAPEERPSPIGAKGEEAVVDGTALKKILDINKMIAATGDVDYVLKAVLRYALELTGAEGGALLLVGESGEISVACQLDIKGGADEIKFSSTLAREVLYKGTPIRTDDAMVDTKYASEASVSAKRLRSVLCLPVRMRNLVIGVLYLHNHTKAGTFANANLQILDAFADQAGIAIETARLLSGSKQRETELSMGLADASRRIKRYEAMLGGSDNLRMDYGALAGASPAMKCVLETIDKIADTSLSVFICGESGTGKELIARALHSGNSKRREKRFVAINCGAIPSTLIESELFGYVKGAFTGAQGDKPGFIEEAGGGTLFLDEVGELETMLQVKLLRVLQEGEFTPVGSTKPKTADVRIVAASNRDIDDMLKAGRLREDFYYRTCQVRIDIPPLRARPEDILPLAGRFLEQYSPAGGKLSLSHGLLKSFFSYDWPGNVRELENLIRVACTLAEGEMIDERAIPSNHPIMGCIVSGVPTMKKEDKRPRGVNTKSTVRAKVQVGLSMDGVNDYDPSKTWRDYEMVITAKCLEANAFKVRPAASELGIAVSTLYKRMDEWGLKDKENPIYREKFVYQRGKALDEYLMMIFKVALEGCYGRRASAIATLGVSQGYFYKVMKRLRG